MASTVLYVLHETILLSDSQLGFDANFTLDAGKLLYKYIFTVYVVHHVEYKILKYLSAFVVVLRFVR